MKIQKYKAKIIGTEEEIIGYVIEGKKYLGNGCYSPNDIDYTMCVTHISMPNGKYGTWRIEPSSIKPVN